MRPLKNFAADLIVFELIAAVPPAYASEPAPDGAILYLGSRDGWVSKYDLWSLKPVAEVRAGVNTRNIAVSSDGKWVMVGNFLPHSLVVLNAHDLSPFRVIPVAGPKGKTSRVSAVYDARPRQSFIVALKDIKEIWELSYDPDAPPVYGNFVHNYRPGQVEGVVVSEQPFAIRRIETEDYLDDFFFDPSYAEVMGAGRTAKKGMVYNLDVRKKIAELDLTGMPHLGSGIVWDLAGRMVMATPHLREAAVSVIDMESWKTVKRIETLGAGFFSRSNSIGLFGCAQKIIDAAVLRQNPFRAKRAEGESDGIRDIQTMRLDHGGDLLRALEPSPLMGADGQPPEHIFRADNGDDERPQGTVQCGDHHKPAGSH